MHKTYTTGEYDHVTKIYIQKPQLCVDLCTLTTKLLGTPTCLINTHSKSENIFYSDICTHL